MEFRGNCALWVVRRGREERRGDFLLFCLCHLFISPQSNKSFPANRKGKADEVGLWIFRSSSKCK